MENWEISNNKLKRTFEFRDFSKAIKFVNRVAELVEAKNHHPDILIKYNKVTLELWTHTEAKVTQKDYELAKEIDKIG